MVHRGVLRNNWFHCFLLAVLLSACSTSSDSTAVVKEEEPVVKKRNRVMAPDFNADTAYQIIQAQVDFGPRVPNTPAHEKCAAYMVGKLKSYELKVNVQEGKVVTYEGKTYRIKNIMGSFHPENKNRVIFFTHWDSRHIADRDTVLKDKPIDAANDGASGVGVLLEIARQLQKTSPGIGVDILLLDAEDTGQPDNASGMEPKEDTWCLGTQYWTKNLAADYAPKYGILLDMVGAKDAVFPMDGVSLKYAEDVVKKVWSTANDLGFSNYFTYTQVGMLTDDHLYINRGTKIPTIDIIHYDPKTSDFGPFHHRHSDNMAIIDRNTLKVVGQTLLQVIFNE